MPQRTQIQIYKEKLYKTKQKQKSKKTPKPVIILGDFQVPLSVPDRQAIQKYQNIV